MMAPQLLLSRTNSYVPPIGDYYYHHQWPAQQAALRDEESLREYDPHIKSEYPVFKDGNSSALIQCLASQLFLPLIARNSRLSHKTFSFQDPTWGPGSKSG